MNAAPAEQLRLLDLAAVDARIAQADHARRNPPQAARVKELLTQRQTLTQELVKRQGLVDDLKSEISRIESDVTVVKARRERDTTLLATTSSPKDAAGLEHELTSLARRLGELEDTELELMESLEAAEVAVAEQQVLVTETNDEGSVLSAAAKAHVADASALYDQATRDRAAVTGGVDGALLSLYERLNERSAGAALVRARTCLGCHMMLSGTDLNTIRQAAADAVVHCPECGCILVRTEESGL